MAVAAGLFTRFGLDDGLRRDEAVYAYGGQQLADGVPPYVSIFDPKTPLATFLAGGGELLARALHAGGLDTMRIVFLVSACLAVGAVYVLGLWLFDSPLAGLAGAVVLASFEGFAVDALGGPDAKTPGMFLSVAAMALLVRRRWGWAALAGSLAFLTWQPLGVYAVAAVACAALLTERGERRRRVTQAIAGAAVPVAAMTLWFWLAGALGAFVEAALRFPLTGIDHGPETLASRLGRIVATVDGDYGRTQILFWAGLVAVLGLLAVRGRDAGARGAAADPYAIVVVATLIALIAFSLTDFQGYPDLYPLLPYAAIGVGGAVALAARAAGGARPRAAATGVSLLAAAALVAASWSWYTGDRAARPALAVERAHAFAAARMLAPGTALYVLGDPTLLVMTGRRNPSRYIYLASGVEAWMLRRTRGGFAGWEARIRAARPGLIALAGWVGPGADRLAAWLRATRVVRRRGRWQLFLPPPPAQAGRPSSASRRSSRRRSAPSWTSASARP